MVPHLAVRNDVIFGMVLLFGFKMYIILGMVLGFQRPNGCAQKNVLFGALTVIAVPCSSLVSFGIRQDKITSSGMD